MPGERAEKEKSNRNNTVVCEARGACELLRFTCPSVACERANVRMIGIELVEQVRARSDMQSEY